MQLVELNCISGASKRGAQRVVHAVIAQMEALYVIQRDIEAKRAQVAGTDPIKKLVELVGSAVTLEDLQQQEARLQSKISQNLAAIKRQDASTATTVHLVLEDKFQGKIYKSQALLMRLCSKVRQALLAAVPFKRRISRAKKGMCLILESTLKWY